MTRTTRMLSLAAALTVTPVAGQAQGRLTADDMAEIHNLYAHYNLVLDAGDSEAWAETFVPDGRFGSSVGRDALIEFANNFHGSNPSSRHWNSNIQITPTADGAAGTCYLMLWNVGVRPAAIILTGVYQDELVKTANGWRFKSRVVTTDRPASR